MENVHERVIAAPAEQVGRLLDRIGSVDDPLWPSRSWPPMRFDRDLGVGAVGGHGPVRYRVTGHEPGRRVEATFDPRIGLAGTHTFTVEPIDAGSCLLRHRLVARPAGLMRLLWPAVVRSCHDAVLEHLLDNAAGTRTVRYPLRARIVVAFAPSRVRTVPVPDEAALLHEAIPDPDLADAYAVRVPPGVSPDPQDWADRVFRDPPALVAGLLWLRNALVTPFGIERGDRSAFDTVARGEREVLLGVDQSHVRFRAGVLVTPGRDFTTVTVATHATGGRYLRLVRLFHPGVVRAMLRRAARTAVSPTRPDIKRVVI